MKTYHALKGELVKENEKHDHVFMAPSDDWARRLAETEHKRRGADDQRTHDTRDNKRA